MNETERLTSLEHRMSSVEGLQATHHNEISDHENILTGDGKRDWGLVARVGVLEWMAVANFILLIVLLILSVVILTQVF